MFFDMKEQTRLYHVTCATYHLNVILESLGDSLRVLGVFLCNDREVTDLVSIVDLEVFERFSKVIRNLSRGRSGERASRRSGRHDNSFTRSRRHFTIKADAI